MTALEEEADELELIESVPCPICWARRSQPCSVLNVTESERIINGYHASRRKRAQRKLGLDSTSEPRSIPRSPSADNLFGDRRITRIPKE